MGLRPARLASRHVTPPAVVPLPACSLLSPRPASPRIQQAAGTPQAARSMGRISGSFGRLQDRGRDGQIAAPFLRRSIVACSLLSPRPAFPRIQQAVGTPQAARSMGRISGSFGRFQDRGRDEQIAAPFLRRGIVACSLLSPRLAFSRIQQAAGRPQVQLQATQSPTKD